MKTLTRPDTFAEFLGECGPRIQGVDAIVQEGDSAWAIDFEDSPPLLLEWVEDPMRVAMSARLGRPPAARQNEVLQALMSYNTLWQSTGGAKTGQAGTDGELLLMYDWYPEIMDADEIPKLIENFSALAAWWAIYVASEVSISEISPANLFDSTHLA